MKNFLLLILFCLGMFSIQSVAQNGIDIEAILSPKQNANFDTSALIDVRVLIQNDGDLYIYKNDTLLIDLSIQNSDPSESSFFNFRIKADTILKPKGVMEITLVENYKLDSSDTYSVCASIRGTTSYPINLTKNAQACVPFVVGNKELQKPIIQHLFFANGKVSFQSNLKEKATVSIFDISGRRIFSQQKELKFQNSISFKAPANGFYFLRITPSNGAFSTSKFVVH